MRPMPVIAPYRGRANHQFSLVVMITLQEGICSIDERKSFHDIKVKIHEKHGGDYEEKD